MLNDPARQILAERLVALGWRAYRRAEPGDDSTNLMWRHRDSGSEATTRELERELLEQDRERAGTGAEPGIDPRDH